MSGEGKLNVVGYGKLLVKPDYAPECYGESTPRFNPDDEEMERMIEVDWELE